MQVTVSRVSAVNVELKVVLPKDRVNTALAKAYVTVGKQAQVRGFRKGKVPLPILKQFYGARVTAEVWGQLVEESLPRALEQEKLEPVVQPEVAPSGDPAEGTDWTYTAKVEVRPDVAEVLLDGIELTRTVYTFSDHDVDHQIEHLRESHSTLRTPEPPRPVAAGDVVTLDYDVTLEGVRRDDMDVRNRSVEVGRGRLLKEIDDGLPGMTIGEPRDIQVKFADNHAREELRAKSAVLKLTVSEIREKVLPAVDDEFAKDTGSDSLAALKTKLREDMEREGKEVTEGQLREAAITALVAKNPIDVPPSLVRNAVGVIARDLAQQMRMQGQELDPKKVIDEAEKQAEHRVRAGLLLGELAKKNNLGIQDSDLEARLEEMAKESGKAVAKLRAEYRDAKKREALANAVLEDKVMALLFSKVKVTDVPSDKPLHDPHDH